MTEQREPYQTILAEFFATGQAIQAEINAIAPKPDPATKLAQLESVRTELLETITYLEERHRKLLHQNQQLREAAWSVCATSVYQQVDQAALRRLANLIDFPAWYTL